MAPPDSYKPVAAAVSAAEARGTRATTGTSGLMEWWGRVRFNALNIQRFNATKRSLVTSHC